MSATPDADRPRRRPLVALALVAGALAVLVASLLLFRTEPPGPPAPLRADALDPAGAVAEALAFDADSRVAAPVAGGEPAKPEPAVAEGPQRTLAERTTTSRLFLAPLRADTKLPTHCRLEVSDAGGQTVRSFSQPSSLFDVEVPSSAVRATLTPEATDLDLVHLDLPLRDRGLVPVEVPLARGAVRGVVYDPHNRPVQGVWVHLDYGRAKRLTQANGSFAFQPLRDGTYVVGIPNETFAPSPPPSQHVRVEGARQHENVVLRVDSAGTIEGEVRDADDDGPIAGATVCLQGAAFDRSSRVVRTDAAGRFTIARVRAGEYDLAVAAKDHQRHVLRVAELAADETRRVEIRLRHGGATIRGRVTGGGGAPLPFARVIAEPSGGEGIAPVRAVADSAGRFRFARLAPGDWRVALAPEYATARNLRADAVGSLRLEPGQTAELSLVTRRGGLIQGRLKRPANAPPRPLSVRVQRGETLVAHAGIDGSSFAFGGLSGGTYTVELLEGGAAAGPVLALRTVTLSEGGTASVEMSP